MQEIVATDQLTYRQIFPRCSFLGNAYKETESKTTEIKTSLVISCEDQFG